MPVDKRERVNIKDLVVDRPEKKDLSFDPETLMTQADWNRIKRRNEWFREQLDKSDDQKFLKSEYLDYIYRTAVLAPERTDLLCPDKGYIGNLIITDVDNRPNKEKTIYLNYYKSLVGDPGMVMPYFNFGPTAYASWIEEQGYITVPRITALASYKIVNSQVNLNEILKRLEPKFKRFLEIRTTFTEQAEIAAWTKVLYGDWEILGLDKNMFWEEAKYWMNDIATGNYAKHQLAFSLKILAAKEIKFTDHGLELVMPQPKPYDANIPTLPEVKKYGS